MTQLQFVQLILSAGFATTLTAMIRRLIPRIDGPALVWGVAIALSIIGNVLLAVVNGHHDWVSVAWSVAMGLSAGIMGCGAVQIAQSAGAKGQLVRTVIVPASDDPGWTPPMAVIPAPPKVPTIVDKGQ